MRFAYVLLMLLTVCLRVGTSALVMALKRKNNTMVKLLLTHGASRYTICECVFIYKYAYSCLMARLTDVMVLILVFLYSGCAHGGSACVVGDVGGRQAHAVATVVCVLESAVACALPG